MAALILCVDDEADICQLLDTILVMSGYRTRLAASGHQALADAAEPPDLVILDVNLPDLDGIEVCRRLRRQDGRVPVLFLTAATDARRREAMAAGGTAFLEKPFDVDELLDLIERLLAERHERRADEDRRRRAGPGSGPDHRAADRRHPAWSAGAPRPASNPSVAAGPPAETPANERYRMVARSANKARGRTSRNA